MHKRSRILAAITAALLLVLPVGGALADDMGSMPGMEHPAAPATGTTAPAPANTVTVGTENSVVSFDYMFPGVTYIHEGETLTFTNHATITPHTVTFAGGDKMITGMDPAAAVPTQPSGGTWDGQHLLNSGMLEPGKSYTVTFTKAGVYDYACALHPLMQGTVVVLPAGVAAPSMDSQNAKAKAAQADAERIAKAVIAGYEGRPVAGSKNADGSVTWKVAAGVGVGSFDAEQFYPKDLVISEGDSIAFTNQNDYEPHWVQFPTSPADIGKFFDEHGPNAMALMTPMGGTSVDGSQLLSQPIMPGQTTTFSFPKAGTYHYVCYLHSGNKMEGDITVQPKGFVHAYINGKPFVYNFRPVHVHNGHVYVPVADFVKALGGSVAWDQASQTVSLSTKGEAKAEAGQGEGIKVMLNGAQLAYGFDPQPHIHDGHVFAPLQVLVDALGGSMTWDAATQTVSVTVK